MQGTLLLFGGNKNLRAEKIDAIVKKLGFEVEKKEYHPDILIVRPLDGKKSIGIDQSRLVIGFLAQRPFSAKHKLVIIEKAQNLTIPAQNALLKTLEEPPSYAIILLETKRENVLLPTVISRCQKIPIRKYGSEVIETSEEMLAYVRALPLGERLVWAQEHSKKSREEVVEMLENWVLEERLNLINKRPQASKNLKVILQLKKDLEDTNVNLRLGLEYVTLKIKT